MKFQKDVKENFDVSRVTNNNGMGSYWTWTCKRCGHELMSDEAAIRHFKRQLCNKRVILTKMREVGWEPIGGKYIRAITQSGVPHKMFDLGDTVHRNGGRKPNSLLCVPKVVVEMVQLFERGEGYAGLTLKSFLSKMYGK